MLNFCLFALLLVTPLGVAVRCSRHIPFPLQVMTSEEPSVDSDSMEVDVIGTRPETSAQVRVCFCQLPRCPVTGDLTSTSY